MKRRHIIAYSAGSLGTALSMQCFNTFVGFFYMDVLKLAPYLFSLAMTVYAIWNAINDPLAGQISDRTRTRWGRRIPYIAGLTLPMVLVFVLVWIAPFRGDQGQMAPLFLYFLVTICAFDGLWTFVVLNWTALFPEMFPEHRDRSEVSAWRQVFSIIGLILGIAMPPLLYSRFGWPAMGIGFAVITAASLFISLLGSHENPGFSQEGGLEFWPAIKATFGNRSFVIFLILNLFLTFVFDLLTAVLPFYAKYALHIGDLQTTALLGCTLILALPMLVLWVRICAQRGARNALLLASAAFGLALLPLMLVRTFLGALAVLAVASFGFAGLLMLTDVMIADLVDEDELKTGVRREGMFFGINGFVIRFSIAMQSMVMAVVLSQSGYNASLPVEAQPTTVALGVRALLSVVPALGLALAFVFTWLFPLHGPRLAEVKARVAALHKAKAERAAGAGAAGSPAAVS